MSCGLFPGNFYGPMFFIQLYFCYSNFFKLNRHIVPHIKYIPVFILFYFRCIYLYKELLILISQTIYAFQAI